MSDPILIVDDDPTFNAVLTRALIRRGFEAKGVMSIEEALAACRVCPPTRVVLDLSLGGASGLALIRPLLDANPGCRIVVLTGYASITTAVDAIKLGAVQYLAKPVEVEAVLAAFEDRATEGTASVAMEHSPLSVERLEWEHIQRVLREHNGNISGTARALNMHRRTLQRKLLKRPVKK